MIGKREKCKPDEHHQQEKTDHHDEDRAAPWLGTVMGTQRHVARPRPSALRTKTRRKGEGETRRDGTAALPPRSLLVSLSHFLLVCGRARKESAGYACAERQLGIRFHK